MPKKYVVDLTEDERQELEKVITTGKHSASRINHARILLKADINQPDGGWPDSEISAALDISIRTIERVRQRFVEESLEAALKRRPGGAPPSGAWMGSKKRIWSLQSVAIRQRDGLAGHSDCWRTRWWS